MIQQTVASFCCSPAVRQINSQGNFYAIQREHSDGVFFMYVGEQNKKLEMFVSIKVVSQQTI